MQPNSCAIAAFAITLLAAPFAHAEPQTISHATANCQTALPVFDGNVRKRPVAVQNEGTSIAFVTCSFPSPEGRQPGSASVTTAVWQYFVNNGANPVTVNCTGVATNNSVQLAEYVPKSIVVTPGAGEQALIWQAFDFAGAPAVFPNQGAFSISCSLPPGAGVGTSYVNGTD